MHDRRAVFEAGLVLTIVRPELDDIEPAPAVQAIRQHEDRRLEMVGSRIESLSVPGDYLDRSPTGSGKTTAYVKALKHGCGIPGFNALVMLPTHANGLEVVGELQKLGVHAAAYCGRHCEDWTDPDGEVIPANCLNPDADDAQKMGLSPARTICRACPQKGWCADEGYLSQLNEAKAAQVATATHARAKHNGIPELASGRSYISIDEDPIGVIRPTDEFSGADAMTADKVVGYILNSKWLNILAEKMAAVQASEEDDGEPVVRATEPVTAGQFEIDTAVGNTTPSRKGWQDECYAFIFHLAGILTELLTALPIVKTAAEFKPSKTMPRPRSIEWVLFQASREQKADFKAAPWRGLLAIADGTFHQAAIIASEAREKGGKPTYSQSVIVVWMNNPPAETVCWYDDATTEPELLQSAIGRPVRDMTPSGAAPTIQKAVQFVDTDIFRSTSTDRVQEIIRGILATHHDVQRLGVITHSNQIKNLKRFQKLEPRLAMLSYFGSGLDRSSNRWHGECDMLVILGSPRVKPAVIRAFLVQIGDIGAAQRQPAWKTRQWAGTTVSGQSVTVKTKGYLDPDWARAYRAIVRAGLVQAIGRARITLDSGIPVLVYTRDECGLRVADTSTSAVKTGGAEERLLKLMADEVLRVARSGKAKKDISKVFPSSREQSPNIYLLAKCSLRTLANCSLRVSALAASEGVSPRRVRTILESLESRGMVKRVGYRTGWQLTPAGFELATGIAVEQPPAPVEPESEQTSQPLAELAGTGAVIDRWRQTIKGGTP